MPQHPKITLLGIVFLLGALRWATSWAASTSCLTPPIFYRMSEIRLVNGDESIPSPDWENTIELALSKEDGSVLRVYFLSYEGRIVDLERVVE